MKNNKFVRFNIIITIALFFLLIIGFVFTFSYQLPDQSKFRTITGTVEDFKQRDGKWYDFILGSNVYSYFKIWLSDDSVFEATGISYDNIDRDLYEIIEKGKEITIGYIDNGLLSQDVIISIEYGGKSYLNSTDVIEDYKNTDKTMKIVGSCIISVSTISACVLYILNYKKNKSKQKIENDLNE